LLLIINVTDASFNQKTWTCIRTCIIRINIKNKTYYALTNPKSSFKINASQIIPAFIYYLSANRCILLINPCNQVSTKKFYQLYRETAYNSWRHSVITETGNFYRTRVECRGVNYVKRKPLTSTYPNEKLTSYISERWPEKYVCICVRMCAWKERSAKMCHNPQLRFFSLFSQCPSRSANLGATLAALDLVLLVAILYRYLNHRCSSL